MMQVNLSFDTDKDSIEEFKKLKAYIEKIIAEKDPVTEKKTSGGCRVIPYQDLENELFSLCSKRRDKNG